MADEGEKSQGKGFKVQDRRRFSDSGESRPAEEAAETARDPEPRAGESAREEKQADATLPEINFSTFVISLSTQALMHLGEIADPLSGKVEKDFPVAKQMIDIISLLHEKTRGNLDPGEQQLMDDVLYDLRMRYVEAVKQR